MVKMTRQEYIDTLCTMAIGMANGRVEKETIEYAIKQIKSAKKWKRKAKIEYNRGFNKGFENGKEQGYRETEEKAYRRGYNDGKEYMRKLRKNHE